MTSERQKRRGWLIPDAHLPAGDKCIRVYYPDHPDYRAALLGALWQLGKWYNWERDASRRAREVAARWRESLAKIDEQCGGGGVDCCDSVTIILNQVAFFNYVRITSESNTLFQTWQETTNITEINSYTTNVYGGESSEPNLCFAVLTLVNATVQEIIARKENESRDNIVLLAASLVVIATAALAFAIPVASAFAAATGAALGSIVFTGFNAYTIEQIRNSNVMSIVNTVYCALKDKSTAYADMSLAPAPATLTGIEREIYNRIAALFNMTQSNEKLKFWQSWLNVLGESRRVGKEASICACVQTYTRVVNFDDLMPDAVTFGTIVAGAGRDGSNAIYTQVITTTTARTYIVEFTINVPANARIKKVKLWVRRTGNLNDIRPFVNDSRIGTISVGTAWTYREFACDIAASNVAKITFSYAAAASSSYTMFHYFDDVYIEYEA